MLVVAGVFSSRTLVKSHSELTMLAIAEKQVLYQELAKLSGAGFGIREAAEVIRANHELVFSSPLHAITARTR